MCFRSSLKPFSRQPTRCALQELHFLVPGAPNEVALAEPVPVKAVRGQRVDVHAEHPHSDRNPAIPNTTRCSRGEDDHCARFRGGCSRGGKRVASTNGPLSTKSRTAKPLKSFLRGASHVESNPRITERSPPAGIEIDSSRFALFSQGSTSGIPTRSCSYPRNTMGKQ